MIGEAAPREAAPWPVLRAELECRLSAFDGDWRSVEDPATRDLDLAGRPLFLLGAGSVLARPFVAAALSRLDVHALVDNGPRDRLPAAAPVVDDAGFLALARGSPRAVAVLCGSSEAAHAHFSALAATAGLPVLSLVQALRRTETPDWSAHFGEPGTVRRLLAADIPLSDDASRQTFHAVLLYRLTGEPRWLDPVRRPEGHAYFFTDALEVGEDEVLVDAGAFTGDTARAFHRRTQGRYRHIHAFEPDPVRLPALRRTAGELGRTTVHAAGLWSAGGDLPCGNGMAGGHLRVTGNKVGAGAERMPVTALDGLDLGPVSVVKMDIEGAELAALDGAAATLARFRPKLAVCVYHRPLDLLDIPAKVRALRPDSALRLRHHGPSLFETVLYAV